MPGENPTGAKPWLKKSLLESNLEALLNEHFPGQFKYNGDYSQRVLIGRKIPDFVSDNGKKIVIEAAGCFYHHCPICCPGKAYGHKNNSKQVVKYYKLHGYDCLIIWEHELKDKLLIQRLKNFIFI